jgi:antitoxin (DNA-binding transcriptional repressor) of toxin-antitoxin stability system
MTKINLTELPENIQSLLDQAQKTGEILTITQDGIPLATISPIKSTKRNAFGCMKGTGEILDDLVEPTSNLVSWESLQ